MSLAYDESRSVDHEIEVLLVDDDPDWCELVGSWLDRYQVPSFHVAWVGSLSEIRAHVDRAPCDAIVLDLGLPDRTGLDTLVSAREVARWLPIVVLTAESDEKVATLAMRAGADDYLVKSAVHSERLMKTILGAIDAQRGIRSFGRSWEESSTVTVSAVDSADLAGTLARAHQDAWVDDVLVDARTLVLSLRVAQEIQAIPGAAVDWFARYRRSSRRRF